MILALTHLLSFSLPLFLTSSKTIQTIKNSVLVRECHTSLLSWDEYSYSVQNPRWRIPNSHTPSKVALHPEENPYAPIKGKALIVAYGLHQCRYFLLVCRDLTEATDHKPLLHVLNDRSLADIQDWKLQNLKEKTLSYRFQIVQVSVKKHPGLHAASRYH